MTSEEQFFIQKMSESLQKHDRNNIVPLIRILVPYLVRLWFFYERCDEITIVTYDNNIL